MATPTKPAKPQAPKLDDVVLKALKAANTSDNTTHKYIATAAKALLPNVPVKAGTSSKVADRVNEVLKPYAETFKKLNNPNIRQQLVNALTVMCQPAMLIEVAAGKGKSEPVLMKASDIAEHGTRRQMSTAAQQIRESESSSRKSGGGRKAAATNPIVAPRALTLYEMLVKAHKDGAQWKKVQQTLRALGYQLSPITAKAFVEKAKQPRINPLAQITEQVLHATH